MSQFIDVPGRGDCLPRDDTFGSEFAVYEEVEAVYPRSQWDELLAAHEGLETLVKKIKNQGNEGSCFPAGTMIRMGDGTQKPIEAVRTLDEVLTGDGRVRRVVATMVRKSTEMMRLRLRGHSLLHATPEHPILTKRGYVAMCDLAHGDLVAMPRYQAAGSVVLETTGYIPYNNHITNARGTAHYGIPGKRSVAVTRTPLPDLIGMTAGWGRIAGLFVAEGSTSHGKLTYTLCRDEVDTLAKDLVDAWRDEAGVEAHIAVRGTNTCWVSVYGTHWSKLFTGLFNTGARLKRLPSEFTRSPCECQQAVLQGWLDGDLSREHGTAREGVSISKELALNMFDIANAAGMRPYIRYRDPRPTGNVKHRHRTYYVGYGEQEPQHTGGFKAECDDQYMWRPVQDVEPVPFVGWVYNIEVDDDHSYVADGIAVHNCASNATCQCFEVAWNMAMGAKHWIEMSPISIYRWVASGPGSGSTISGNLRQLKDVGCLPVDNAENRAILKAAGRPESHVLKTTGYSQSFPSNWKETAAFFRALEWLDISSFEGMVSAIFEGFPVCYGRAGHAICGARIVKRNGVWTVKYANSWGNWGESGYGYDSESYISNAIRSYGAWALRCPLLTDAFLALTEAA